MTRMFDAMGHRAAEISVVVVIDAIATGIANVIDGVVVQEAASVGGLVLWLCSTAPSRVAWARLPALHRPGPPATADFATRGYGRFRKRRRWSPWPDRRAIAQPLSRPEAQGAVANSDLPIQQARDAREELEPRRSN
jgi:hypothetical protein